MKQIECIALALVLCEFIPTAIIIFSLLFSGSPPVADSQPPCFSILIPVRNENLLDRLIKALMAQDYPRDRFEVIIIDHHNPLLKIPEAKILVNPKLDGNTQDFKELCNGGVVWYFAEEAFENKIPETLGNSLLTLASLASISDMVVQVAYNKEIIEKGLKALEETSRLGLQAFSDIFGKLRTNTQKIISSLNTAESSHFQNASYLLLTSDSFEECETIARELADKMFYKQEQIKSITAEVERRISGKLDELVIFEGDPAWKSILAGSVASVIAAKYRKPCFIFKRMDEESVGSVRSLREGESAVEALKHCAEVLVSYGGHPKAAGFRVKNKNLEKFKNKLTEYFKR